MTVYLLIWNEGAPQVVVQVFLSLQSAMEKANKYLTGALREGEKVQITTGIERPCEGYLTQCERFFATIGDSDWISIREEKATP